MAEEKNTIKVELPAAMGGDGIAKVLVSVVDQQRLLGNKLGGVGVSGTSIENTSGRSQVYSFTLSFTQIVADAQ